MSLVNDALKRAKQAQARPAAVAVNEPALEPVAHPNATAIANWVLAAVGTVSLLLACWFLIEWWRAPAPTPTLPLVRSTAAAPAPSRPAAASTGSAVPIVEKKPEAAVPLAAPPPVSNVTTVAAAAPATAAPTSTNAPKESTTEVAVVTERQTTNAVVPDESLQASTPDSQLSNLKLQGIFYRTRGASALINGETLFLGDEIEGAKLVAVERQSVQMLLRGKVHVLRLR